MEYIKLLRILWNKEGIHYRRLGKCLANMDNWPARLIAWPLICIIITIFHYCFASMHFLFESFLFLFKRKQFNSNMTSLWKNVSK